MDRRAFVRGLAVLGAGGAFAGCSANREVPETAPPPPPEVRSATPAGGDESGEGSDDTATPGTESVAVADAESANSIVLAGQGIAQKNGNVVVTITTRNDGTNRAVALVRVRIDTAFGTRVVEQFVALLPGESTTVRFTPDVAYDDYSGHVVEILAETPATPLPSDTPSPTQSMTVTPTADEGTDTDGGT